MELVKTILLNKLRIYWGELMKKHRIVIDQGTSGTKGILFNVEKSINKVDRIDLPHKQIFPEKGWFEHDPIELKNNVEILIRKIIQKNELEIEDILSISITNQRESVVVWERANGEPLSNIMVWQCNRGIEICEKLRREGYNETIKRKTGLTLDPYFSASKLKHFFDSKDLSPEQTKRVLVGTVDAWLIWNLTKGKKFVTDISNASRTLLYNIVEKKWDKELVDLFNVPMESLPEVVSSVSNFGEYNGIPIVSCMADSQSALYGHLATDYGDIKATLGTGSSVLMNTGEKIASLGNSILTTIAWEKNDKTIYAAEGIIRSFGDLLNWEKYSLRLFSDFDEASNLAFSVTNNGGVYLIPALEGMGAPFWQPKMKALFLGMTRDTTREHLLRATFEAMAFQIRAVIDEFKKYYNPDLDKPMKEIHVDGGASRNSAFMQMLADITQMEIVVDETEELSALGTLTILGEERNMININKKAYIPKNDYDEYYLFWKNTVNNISMQISSLN